MTARPRAAGRLIRRRSPEAGSVGAGLVGAGLVRAGLVRAGLVRALAVAVAGVVVVLGAATTASAHSQLDRSDPADGSRVAAVPERITLTFNQSVLGLGIVLKVRGPDGSVTDGTPTVKDNQVRQAILPGSAAGAYTVLWRVTSADGHPISGRFAFTAAAGSSGTSPTVAATGTGVAGTATAAATATGQPVVVGSGSDGSGSDGPDPALIWLLIAFGAAAAAGVFLAVRRPGPTLAEGQRPASDESTTGTPANGDQQP